MRYIATTIMGPWEENDVCVEQNDLPAGSPYKLLYPIHIVIEGYKDRFTARTAAIGLDLEIEGTSIADAFQAMVLELLGTFDYLNAHSHELGAVPQKQLDVLRFHIGYKSLSDRFKRLVKNWRVERGATSSLSVMVGCQSYRQIIALGEEAIPLLLKELQQRPDFWFEALQTITKVDPVPYVARGSLDLMTKAWLEWGAKNGYLNEYVLNAEESARLEECMDNPGEPTEAIKEGAELLRKLYE